MGARRQPAPAPAPAHRLTLGRGPLLALLLPLALVAGVACTGKHHQQNTAPHPPPSFAEVTTTTLTDFSGVALAGVPGRTTTTVAIGPGSATITGMVLAPEGPVPGATVHVERLVGDSFASTDLASDATGRYTLPGIRGGRYRVRAFVPHPIDLAQTQPAIFFLGASESKVQDLQVNHFTGTDVAGVIAPSPPPVDGPANLVVQVTSQQVDPKGVVRGTPIVNATVVLSGSSNWVVQGDNGAFTDTGGRAVFHLTCTAEGPQPLQAIVGGTTTVPLDLAPCAVPPPTTTTTATTAPPPSSSTTQPPPTTAKPTTTTTRRPGGTTTSTTKH